MFCRMYGLAAMLSVTTPTTSKTIDTKFYFIYTNLLWFGTQFWVSNLFHFSQKSKSYFDITFQCIHFQKSLFSKNVPWFWGLKTNSNKVKTFFSQLFLCDIVQKLSRWQGFPVAKMTLYGWPLSILKNMFFARAGQVGSLTKNWARSFWCTLLMFIGTKL